jgi:hypothetical protein
MQRKVVRDGGEVAAAASEYRWQGPAFSGGRLAT